MVRYTAANKRMVSEPKERWYTPRGACSYVTSIERPAGGHVALPPSARLPSAVDTADWTCKKPAERYVMDEQYVGRAPPALPLAACEGLELFFFFFSLLPFRARCARPFLPPAFNSSSRRGVGWGRGGERRRTAGV